VLKKEPKFPYSIRVYKNWLHVTHPRKVRPFNPKGKSLSNFKSVVSGSFSWNRKPISIMIENGKTICNHSAHYWITDRNGVATPESVLWYNKNGTYGISRVAFDHELPDRDNIVWAIGGCGLGANYNPSEEGFVGAYADVFRKTSHMILGFDKYGMFNALEVAYMSRSQIEYLCRKLGFVEYILVDGGHVTSSNVDGHKYRPHVGQYYAVSLEN